MYDYFVHNYTTRNIGHANYAPFIPQTIVIIERIQQVAWKVQVHFFPVTYQYIKKWNIASLNWLQAHQMTTAYILTSEITAQSQQRRPKRRKKKKKKKKKVAFMCINFGQKYTHYTTAGNCF